MKRMTKKWLALMLAASLVMGEGSFVSMAETLDGSDVVVETMAEENNEVGTGDGSDTETQYDMFPGVTAGVTLGANDSERREDLLANFENAGDFAEGTECVENQILVMAETEELALEYAAAYNGELASYVDGLATINLNANNEYSEASVRDAVLASADPANNLPVAWPNTYYFIQPVDELASIILGGELVENPVEGTADELGAEIMASAESMEFGVVNAYNDPYLNAKSVGYQWFHAAIGSYSAWNSGYTGKGVKVAVLDTGAQVGHEDMANVTRYNVSAVNGLADNVGHGSHVCGLVGATANNGKGGTGVAPGASIHSIKVSDKGSIPTSNVYEALTKAESLNVDIINMSLGGPSYNGVYAEKIKALYDKGIAVFCAAGNESTSAWAYPASYTGAISIAALDKSMQRTYFSNYGSNVDYAAPGYDIVSCYNGSATSYVSNAGTSMACPIIAGEAAVLLQYAREKGVYTEENSGKDVENLMKLMNKGAVKAGSGTGKGYISLSKAMNLGSSLKAPAAPTFSQKAGTYNTDSLTISISAEGATSVYYTIDGKTPTYKNGVVSENAIKYIGAFTIGGNKAVTVKAIAINDSAKLVSKVASAKYTFKPNVKSITLTSDSGFTVMAGKSLSLKANVNPSYAANKKVDWSVSPADKGVTVKNGKVSASASAAGKYTVTATAKDGSNVKGSATITVVAASENPISKIVKKSKGNVTLVNGSSAQVEVEVQKKDKTTVDAKGNVTWYSENTSVATVVVSAANTITVTGVAKGKTNIIGAAADGSGVKIKIPVNVGLKVSSITLQGGSQLAAGKSLALKATVNPKDAANKSVTWSVSPADKGVTVKNGKVTASKTATKGDYVITAIAADGYGATAKTTIKVIDSGITSIKLDKTKADIFRVKNAFGASNTVTIPVTVTGGSASNWEVTSSAPGIATVSKSGSNIVVTATGNATGKATITVKATDGSNKKATCKVTVKNPASNLLLSAPGGRCYSLARGKSLALKATLETEYGKLDSSAKKLKWTSSNKALATVDSKGKVTAKENQGIVIITAETTDGSELVASVEINLTSDVLGVNLADSNGKEITSITLPEGYYTIVSIKSVSVSLEDWLSGGVTSDCFTYKASGNGIGVQPDGFDFIVVGNKKGTYTLTVGCQNGSSGKGTLKVIVK